MSEVTSTSRRLSVYQLLEISEGGGRLSRVIDLFLILLISVNVLAVIFETVESVQDQYAIELYWLELFSVAVFTVEYLLRIWSCVESPEYNKGQGHAKTRLSFMLTPMAIVDLIAILPFFLAFIFNIDLRFLRALRLLRIFKLTRYSASMTTLLTVLHDEISNFAAAIFIMIIIMIIAASGIYLVEHDHQPEVFGSIPQSMWWAIVTLTTVGYGDVTPVTMVGKLFASMIMLAGVGLVALPTGILASSFSENLKRNRETLTKELRTALEDGIIDEDEQRALNALSRQLGISDEVMSEITRSLVEHKSDPTAPIVCPSCGHSIEVKTIAEE